jgi:hypothetical protein
MKTCKKCLREFDDSICVCKSPVHELGELISKVADQEKETDLCPDCRKEKGIFTLLGFGQ